MVQIGNFHIGKGESSTKPKIDIGEAFILSQQLYYRHVCLAKTKHYHKWAKDTELKALITTGKKYLEKEIGMLEEQMDKYNVAQPTRSPESVKVTESANDTSLINDQLIMESIRDGCVAAIQRNLRNAIAVLHSDSLRVMFIDFVKEEADVMLQCCKYAKAKGWLPVYPIYNPD
ncbi:DUF3231 family protein [Natroniella sulfidigena]|uniref:DUF3231 family protein n=1 Tax=Natroniella sulfidigena TaxID=723921 RepID=UPI00200A112C|nr:DUF3231 family protein [Natroniella sulfidigena]MCK8818069.1 DUF3231 family protein [Natroniella sulfidigena]